jgi:hypothetical protein
MTPIQIATTRQVLSLVGRTRPSVPFFYCALGAEGLPLLLVDAEAIPAEVMREAVLGARRKVFVQGRVERAEGDGALLFRVRDVGGSDQFVADLGGVLDEMIPGLRFSRVDLLG